MTKQTIIDKDGNPVTLMERPEGLGNFQDYLREAGEFRKKYAHLLKDFSLDKYLEEKHQAALRE